MRIWQGQNGKLSVRKKGNADMKSIIQANRDRCYLCGRRATPFDPLDEHHVFFGPFRKTSEKYGLKVYIHHSSCHIFGEKAVHKDAEVCRNLQAEVQQIAMKHYGWSIPDCIRIIGRNYIENVDTCVMCGEYVPEGVQYCKACEAKVNHEE